jgi:phosphatidylethanolamine/phosphatidyl-N-methylethanolamine N-methyltransferase
MHKSIEKKMSKTGFSGSASTVVHSAEVARDIWRERGLFLLNFLKNPVRNASVVPSSKVAGKAIISGIDWDKIETVVELGPGQGTFTRAILAACRPGTKIILIDLEESYVDLLRQQFGSRVTVVHASAHRLNEILEEMNLPKADLIISSLPFLQKQIHLEIFNAILKQTEQGAIYRFFTYIPPVMKWHYRELPLHKVKFVLENIPPMWIYGIN